MSGTILVGKKKLLVVISNNNDAIMTYFILNPPSWNHHLELIEIHLFHYLITKVFCPVYDIFEKKKYIIRAIGIREKIEVNQAFSRDKWALFHFNPK